MSCSIRTLSGNKPDFGTYGTGVSCQSSVRGNRRPAHGLLIRCYPSFTLLSSSSLQNYFSLMHRESGRLHSEYIPVMQTRISFVALKIIDLYSNISTGIPFWLFEHLSLSLALSLSLSQEKTQWLEDRVFFL